MSATSFIGDVTGDLTGTADVATQFPVTANNSTDETCYPLFSDGATGQQGAESDTGLTYNPSSGLLTAASFSGNGAALTDVDAATLDGDSKAKFVRTDNASSMAGQLTMTLAGAFPLKINNNDNAKIDLGGSTNPYIQFKESTTNKAEIAWDSAGYLKLNNSEDSSQLRLKDDLDFSADGTNFYSILHTNNTSSITSTGTLTGLTVSGNILMTGTGAIDVAAGTTGQRPGSPSAGMFRYNSTTAQFEGYTTTWGAIGGGGGATGGGSDAIFVENSQTITTDYTLGTNKNASSVGDLAIDSGVTVTIPANATWVVL